MLEISESRIIIDAGPDFRQQMLKNDVRTLDAILITHGHKDHVGGLDDVRAFNYLAQKAMPVYAGMFAFPDLKREFHYAFEEDKYPGAPSIELVEITGDQFNINEINITPIRAKHYKNEVFGFRIGDLTYITDTNEIPDTELEKIKDSKIVILNALRKEKHYSHFNLDEAIKVIEQLNPEQAYFTHISHLMGLHKEVEKDLPRNIKLAYDGLEIQV
tara:strand:+ start:54 stop:701 length:648 start_codon:yes stop_codon:yes gene_type:complete